MASYEMVEAVLTTLKDIKKSSAPFRGILTVFASDFRQILPVVKDGNSTQIIEECVKNSSF